MVVDPLREVDLYLEAARKEHAEITHIFETHFHADFVSGHVSLAKDTGAKIIYGPGAKTAFDTHVARHGETFKIGDVSVEVLHTPGHTMESSCYLVRLANGKPHAIFTGDTLFLGDVGRPDLAQKQDVTTRELAGILYDSLREHILPLPDDLIIYPGHGAGSSCGKNMMKETVDTLGNQKKVNYALDLQLTRSAFAEKLTHDLAKPPKYFPANVALNRKGYRDTDELLKKSLKGFDPKAFYETSKNTEVRVLDVRSPEAFIKCHVPGSLFVGLDGSFAPWVGTLLVDVLTPVLLVCPEGRAKEAVTRLARVGFDHTLGYLQGGMSAWQSAGLETDHILSVTAKDLEKRLRSEPGNIIDVRKEAEYSERHILGSQNKPLDELQNRVKEIQTEKPFFVHCAGGYRSVIATSILKSSGIASPINVEGGFQSISGETQIPLTR